LNILLAQLEVHVYLPAVSWIHSLKNILIVLLPLFIILILILFVVLEQQKDIIDGIIIHHPTGMLHIKTGIMQHLGYGLMEIIHLPINIVDGKVI